MLKISVITPSYNQGNFIEDTIQSVIDQQYPNFEHIIMDGASTDNTVDILRKYKHLVWKSEKDNGQTHALNKALNLVTGDIVAWINSDDLFCKGTFKRVNEIVQANNDIFFLTGSLYHIDVNNNIKKTVKAKTLQLSELLNGCATVIQPGTFFKKEVVDAVGCLNENLRFCMDYEYFLRILHQFNHFAFPDEYFACYRDYEFTKTQTLALDFFEEIYNVKKEFHANMFSVKNLILRLSILKKRIYR